MRKLILNSYDYHPRLCSGDKLTLVRESTFALLYRNNIYIYTIMIVLIISNY